MKSVNTSLKPILLLVVVTGETYRIIHRLDCNEKCLIRNRCRKKTLVKLLTEFVAEKRREKRRKVHKKTFI